MAQFELGCELKSPQDLWDRWVWARYFEVMRAFEKSRESNYIYFSKLQKFIRVYVCKRYAVCGRSPTFANNLRAILRGLLPVLYCTAPVLTSKICEKYACKVVNWSMPERVEDVAYRVLLKLNQCETRLQFENFLRRNGIDQPPMGYAGYFHS